MMILYWKIVLLFHVTWTVSGRPRHTPPVDDETHDYLMRFGYLPESDLETGNLRTDEQLTEAIKNLQVFGGISPTGEIDHATRKLMRAPRCGVKDPSDQSFSSGMSSHSGYSRRHKRFVITNSKWHHNNLTWSLRTETLDGLNRAGVRAELARALDLWARNSNLTFTETNHGQADILIYFLKGSHNDGYPFDGRGQILAHAFFPGRDRGGDAHFDKDEIWLLRGDVQQEGTSLFHVAAHEFGHSLGLGHTLAHGALMYPWYQGFSADFELPDDDKLGIQQMYGAPTRWAKIPRFGSYPGRHRPRLPMTTTTTTTTTMTTMVPRYRPVRPNRVHPTYPKTTHRTWHRVTPLIPSDVPETCNTNYDAISIIRRELVIFKGKYLWRVINGSAMSGYPAEITRIFQFYRPIDRVDAVYERLDKKIVFFVGRYYYMFNAHMMLPGYPKPLTDLGLPHALQKVDGAMIWGHNSRTYIFSGTVYWRLDNTTNKVELEYPRDIDMFKGVPYNIDAVFQHLDGKTYFFKGKSFWEFDDLRMKVAHEKPKISALVWMGCNRSQIHYDNDEDDTNLPTKSKIVSGSDRSTNAMGLSLLFTLVVLARLS